MNLTSLEWERYSRQINLPTLGLEGQLKLKQAKVLLIGMGGLGSISAPYLAAAGVGTLGLVDFDQVELHNLHRQVLYTTAEAQNPLGVKKVLAAEERLKSLNPEILVQSYPEKASPSNILQLIQDYDLILDGSDNFATRYLVNDACLLMGKTYVFASVYQFQGQLSLFDGTKGPCYRCLFPHPPSPESIPNCAQGGVLGALPGLMGILQANEALKWILGIGTSLLGKLLCVDSLSLQFSHYQITKDKTCPQHGLPIKGLNHLLPLIAAEEKRNCFMNIHRPRAGEVTQITPKELKRKMDQGEDFFLLDVRQIEEYALANLGGLLIPLPDLPSRFEELRPHEEKEIVVLCHHGIRSRQACSFLQSKGYKKLINLQGGIDLWSHQVDPSVPRY